ncbi:hypothetical protein AB595_13740 [Massilia sp. WF1]|nr:hypothetical protein AM586_09880 [Massilia sp. WG5]KLU36288.1 hypothetical protein AB595_13740 [Massilia sp. WF1]
MKLAQLLNRWRPGRDTNGGDPAGEPDRVRVAEAVERIIALSPHLRMARRYEARLAPAVTTTLRYVGGIVAAIPPAREASAAAWSLDPYIHAFFGSADEVAPVLSRSRDLRTFFEQNPGQREAWAVLGMAMLEKRVLGTTLEGETMRREEIQETIGFSDHQVRMCGRTEPELREEIVRRLVVQLGLQGIARYAAQQTRRGLLESERALLHTRLQLLERKGIGMGAIIGGDAQAAGTEELARLQEAINENESAIERLGLRSEALDRELAEVCAVLADPAAHLFVHTRRCVLNRMNVVQPPDSRAAGDEVVFEVARVPTVPPEARAFTLVRFARADLCSATALLDDAARLLG